MTRPPALKSKLKRLTFIPLNYEEELVVEDFKKLCIQDALTVHDLFLEAIKLAFKAHHWPPGNPQLTLQVFNEGFKAVPKKPKCTFIKCKNESVGSGVSRKGDVVSFCKFHFDIVEKQNVYSHVYHDLKLYEKPPEKIKELLKKENIFVATLPSEDTD